MDSLPQAASFLQHIEKLGGRVLIHCVAGNKNALFVFNLTENEGNYYFPAVIFCAFVHALISRPQCILFLSPYIY